MNEEYISKKEAAEKASVTIRTLSSWMTKGLPFYKIGTRKVLFKWSEIDQWIRENSKRKTA